MSHSLYNRSMETFKMKTHRSIVAFLAAILVMCLLASASFAQQKQKTSYTFHGKVEAVANDSLTVNGEKVQGWMDAMTMKYQVDKPEAIKKIKVGDQIQATVYEGDYTLHDVQVVPAEKKK